MAEEEVKNNPHKVFETLFIVSEIGMIALYTFYTEFSEKVHPGAQTVGQLTQEQMQNYYPIFQDVHVMIFIGFGFLLVFLKTYCWTAIGYNFLIAAFCLQFTIPISAFWHDALVVGTFRKVPLNTTSLIVGDFGAAAVLITFGVLLGKTNIHQLWVLAIFEILFYGMNQAIGAGILEAVDMGGAMYVHTFGAYFGLAATYFFSPKKAMEDTESRNEGGYNSQLIAMIGTLFLWMYWPSFNSAMAAPDQQQRVIINTIMAISASCITACGICRLFYHRLHMDVVLHATLAGGVAIGSASSLIVTASISMMIGSVAGIISAVGFLVLSGFLQDNIRLHDTVGIHNLHGLPGLLGGVVGAASVTFAERLLGSTAAAEAIFPAIAAGERTFEEQGWMQLCALGVTLGVSLLGGAFSGFIASRCGTIEHFFDDESHWRECAFDFPLEDPNEAEDEEGEQAEKLDDNQA